MTSRQKSESDDVDKEVSKFVKNWLTLLCIALCILVIVVVSSQMKMVDKYNEMVDKVNYCESHCVCQEKVTELMDYESKNKELVEEESG